MKLFYPWSLKAGTHRPNCWTSEAFGETRTRSATNMFGVFSCVGGLRIHADIVSEPEQCVGGAEVTMATSSYHNEPESIQCEPQPNHSHLSRMPSIWSTSVFSGRTNTESILCVLFFPTHSVPHFVLSFPVFLFWITSLRLAPPAVKEAYCILRRRRTYML